MQEVDEIDVEGDTCEHDDSDCLQNAVDTHKLTEFTPSGWLSEQQLVSSDHWSDEESRAVIEQMLQEEQYYISGTKATKMSTLNVKKEENNKTAIKRTRWTDEEKSELKKGIEIHGHNWLELEKLLPERNLQQIKSFVRRNQHVQSSQLRTSGHDLSHAKIPTSLEEAIAVVTTGHPTVAVTRDNQRENKGVALINKSHGNNEVIKLTQPHDEDTDEDVDIEITSDSDDCTPVVATNNSTTDNSSVSSLTKEITSENNFKKQYELICDADSLPHSEMCNSDLTPSSLDLKNNVDLSDTPQTFLTNNSTLSKVDNFTCNEHQDDGKDDHDVSDGGNDLMDGFQYLSSSGVMVNLPAPTEEKSIQSLTVSDEERIAHYEFFDCTSAVKTPDRYLKIRNYLVDAWNKGKPDYLSKTSARKGLKHCGDVNCIGRIHAYLEQTGIINFGCEQARYNQPCSHLNRNIKQRFLVQPGNGKDGTNKSTSVAHPVQAGSGCKGVRKRRVRDAFGDWVDEKELQGKTISHEICDEKELIKPTKTNRSYDPFKLIPCIDFTPSNPAPFSVIMESCAVLVMDVHSHLSKTEVIGLLGGHYSQQERCLWIQQAKPCSSLSTGMQCEMDPVSQTEACEQILQNGQNVLGWYHSHPMFVANPSIRDMETQQDFQKWFALEDCPFVGVIVSPYGDHLSNLTSEVKLLMAIQDVKNTQSSSMPYTFDYKMSHSQWKKCEVLDKIKELANDYYSKPNHVEMLHHFRNIRNVTCLEKAYQNEPQSVEKCEVLDKIKELANDYYSKPNHVEMLHHFRNIRNVTCLEKMLVSLKSYFDLCRGDHLDTTEREEFISTVEEIFLSLYQTNEEEEEHDFIIKQDEDFLNPFPSLQ